MSNTGFNNYLDHATDYVLANHLMLNQASVTTPGMAIKAGSSAIAKFANTVNYTISGKPYAKTTADAPLPTTYTNAAGVSVAATIPDDYKALVAFYLDAAGNVTSDMTIPVAYDSTAAIHLPKFADTKVCIGAVLIKNESGAVFTNATTALDVTGVTTTYYNFTKSFPLMEVVAAS